MKGVDEIVVAVAASHCLDGHGVTILTRDRGFANDIKRLYMECERHPFREDFQSSVLYQNMKFPQTGMNVLFFLPSFAIGERIATYKIRK